MSLIPDSSTLASFDLLDRAPPERRLLGQWRSIGANPFRALRQRISMCLPSRSSHFTITTLLSFPCISTVATPCVMNILTSGWSCSQGYVSVRLAPTIAASPVELAFVSHAR